MRGKMPRRTTFQLLLATVKIKRFSIAYIRKQHSKMLATELKRCITSGKMPTFERSYKLGPKDPAKGRLPSEKVSAMIVRDIKKGTTAMYDLWPWPHVAARIMELLKRPQRASKQRVGKPHADFNLFKMANRGTMWENYKEPCFQSSAAQRIVDGNAMGSTFTNCKFHDIKV